MERQEALPSVAKARGDSKDEVKVERLIAPLFKEYLSLAEIFRAIGKGATPAKSLVRSADELSHVVSGRGLGEPLLGRLESVGEALDGMTGMVPQVAVARAAFGLFRPLADAIDGKSKSPEDMADVLLNAGALSGVVKRDSVSVTLVGAGKRHAKVGFFDIHLRQGGLGNTLMTWHPESGALELPLDQYIAAGEDITVARSDPAGVMVAQDGREFINLGERSHKGKRYQVAERDGAWHIVKSHIDRDMNGQTRITDEALVPIPVQHSRVQGVDVWNVDQKRLSEQVFSEQTDFVVSEGMLAKNLLQSAAVPLRDAPAPDTNGIVWHGATVSEIGKPYIRNQVTGDYYALSFNEKLESFAIEVPLEGGQPAIYPIAYAPENGAWQHRLIRTRGAAKPDEAVAPSGSAEAAAGGHLGEPERLGTFDSSAYRAVLPPPSGRLESSVFGLYHHFRGLRITRGLETIRRLSRSHSTAIVSTIFRTKAALDSARARLKEGGKEMREVLAKSFDIPEGRVDQHLILRVDEKLWQTSQFFEAFKQSGDHIAVIKAADHGAAYMMPLDAIGFGIGFFYAPDEAKVFTLMHEQAHARAGAEDHFYLKHYFFADRETAEPLPDESVLPQIADLQRGVAKAEPDAFRLSKEMEHAILTTTGKRDLKSALRAWLADENRRIDLFLDNSDSIAAIAYQLAKVGRKAGSEL